jgi:hypothetical protein
VKHGPHTDESRQSIRVALVKYWSDSEVRVRHGELTKGRMARPGVSERIAERTKVAMADPVVAARHRAALARPETRAKISARTKQAMADPAVRERIGDGMALARESALAELRALWRRLDRRGRAQFLAEIEVRGGAGERGATSRAA